MSRRIVAQGDEKKSQRGKPLLTVDNHCKGRPRRRILVNADNRADEVTLPLRGVEVYDVAPKAGALLALPTVCSLIQRY